MNLKSESMKDRHWKTLLRKINLSNLKMLEVTLGDLWEHKLLKYEK